MDQRPSRDEDHQAPRPRILQFNKRRYSIRLEPVFWRVLEDLAERRDLRLGEFIARLEDGYGGRNFSSFLRVFCMLEIEKLLARAELAVGRNSLLDLVASCPTPGLLLSRYRTIITHNQAFSEWLGPTAGSIAGADLTSLVQVRTRRSLNDVWLDMIVGQESRIDARVLYVAPGRVNAAQATLVALNSEVDNEFYAVMWLTAAAPQSRPAAAPARPAAQGLQA